MEPTRQNSLNNLNHSLDNSSISVITPDSDTTLYLEDDNCTLLNVTGIELENDTVLLQLDDENKLNWTSDQHLNFENTDEIVDVLKSNQIRWFYKNIPSKQWVEFNGYDSLRIENKLNNLTENEWRYYTYKFTKNHEKASQTNPNKLFPTSGTLRTPDNETGCNRPSVFEDVLSLSSDTADKVIVRGGLYEVDLLKRTCSSIFWPGEETVITRGTWFYDNTWQPVEMDVSEELEQVHLSLFIGKKMSEYVHDAKAPKKVVHTALLAENNIDWYSPMEVYLYSQATPSKIVRNLTSRLGGYFQKKSGYRLLRGYKELATDRDKPKDITHLVFVVHGIGQKMDIGGRILHNTSLLRQTLTSLQEKLFPESAERAEFFPVEWRTNLKLDGGLVEAITPLHLTQLRNILNTSAMDIMYYTSPIYCAEIQRGLVTEINRLYAMFLERNPSHNIKVSIIGHSLGCVIVYDIITGWQPISPKNAFNDVPDEIIPGKSRLDFHVDNLFLLGSPLAVFLALRYPQGQHGYHLFPPTLCNRLYNIFHISDAVAYRLEPLVRKDYARIAPLRVWPCNCPTRVSYSDMPLELIDPQEATVTKDQSVSSPKEEASPVETPVKDRGWNMWWSLVLGGGAKCQDGAASPQQIESPTRGNSLEHRLDYVIKVSGTLGVNARTYINMLSSHTAYWGSDDVAFFILTRIFPQLDQLVEPSTELSDES